MLSCSLNDWLDIHFKTVRFSEFCSLWINPKSCNYHELPVPCEPKPQKRLSPLPAMPAQPQHSLVDLHGTAPSTGSAGDGVVDDASQGCSNLKIRRFKHRPNLFISRFSHFGQKQKEKPMLCRLMSLSLSDSKKNSSFIWRLDPARFHTREKMDEACEQLHSWIIEYTKKKCLKSAKGIKTSFDSNPARKSGKILCCNTPALRAARPWELPKSFLGAQDSARKIPRRGGLAPYLSNTYTYIYNVMCIHMNNI